MSLNCQGVPPGWRQEGPLELNSGEKEGKYLYIPFQFFQKVLFTLFSHVQLLPFVEEVVVFKCWQVLGLGKQQRSGWGVLWHSLRDVCWGHYGKGKDPSARRRTCQPTAQCTESWLQASVCPWEKAKAGPLGKPLVRLEEPLTNSGCT